MRQQLVEVGDMCLSLELGLDSVVARQRLRVYGIKAYAEGESGFSFGRLHALEQGRADEAEREFSSAWTALPDGKLHRWLRR